MSFKIIKCSCGISRKIQVFPFRCSCGKTWYIDGTTTGKTNKKKMKGLGDLIERFTKFFGFKTCCACEKRKSTFNKLFPFK